MAPGPKLLIKEPVSRHTRSNGAKADARNSYSLETTNDTSTADGIAQTFDESIKSTQLALFGCISNLASARGFFRLDCFEQQEYPFSCDTVPLKQTFTGLKRGVSEKVDLVLNLLVSFGNLVIFSSVQAVLTPSKETGVRDALKRGYLAALVFTIHEKADNPQDALEQWKLSISYTTDPRTHTRVPTGVNIHEVRKPTTGFTVGRARQILVKFIQAIVSYSTGLPDLPKLKRLSLQTVYTDECPEGYVAPNFNAEEPETARFPENEHWEAVSRSVATMEAGHHAAVLTATHLTWRGDSMCDRVPSGLPCTKAVAMAEHKIGQFTGTSSAEVRTHPNSQPPTHRATPIEASLPVREFAAMGPPKKKKAKEIDLSPPASELEMQGQIDQMVSNMSPFFVTH